MIIRLCILGLLHWNYSRNVFEPIFDDWYMAAETAQLPIAPLLSRHNILLSRTLYSKLNVQLLAYPYRRFFVCHAIQITPCIGRVWAVPRNLVARSARNESSQPLPGAVSRKSDNFAGQLRYRAVRRGTRDERWVRRADTERERSRGGQGAENFIGWRAKKRRYTRRWIVLA